MAWGSDYKRKNKKYVSPMVLQKRKKEGSTNHHDLAGKRICLPTLRDVTTVREQKKKT